MAIYNDDMNKKYADQGMKEQNPKQGGFKKPGTEQQPVQNPARKPGQETTSNPKGPFQANR